MKLDKPAIVAAAIDLLNEVGIDALSTRQLAQRLGVQQPALYWHFRSKRDLLNAMNAEMLRRWHTCLAPEPGQSWQAFVRANAISFRRALLSVRDGARVHAGTEAEPGDVAKLQQMMAFMTAQGFSPARVMALMIASGRYVVGCVLEEQSDAPAPEAIAALDDSAAPFPDLASALAVYRDGSAEAHFLAGLDLLIAGMEAKSAD
jgi:TetR/AcrR family transcriptional regulator, tetracycline repressor protein